MDIDTSFFYPQMEMDYFSPYMFFVYRDYLKHQTVKEVYHKSSDFHIRNNSFDKDGDTTKIVVYRYSINNNKDTILTDSTVFEIFYEE